ncbi:MAG: GntR family transcriptional regulator [Chloroflexi bacterium]|nr:GntR family transcriptional regulator [Chloroflexota bacterium]
MTDFYSHKASPKLSSLAEQVYDHLRLAVISSALKPGEKLVEMDIAAQMGTSQGPVREALQRLEHDGLVERRARIGSFVSELSYDEMYELVSVRSSIESFAIRRASTRITDEQCDELDDLVERMAAAGTNNDIMMLAQLDMNFHRRIVELSGSTTLLRVWSSLSNPVQRFVVQSHMEKYTDFVEIGLRHRPIVEALRARDGDAAVESIQTHLMLIWQVLDREPRE